MHDPDLESALSGARHYRARQSARASRVDFDRAGLDKYTLYAIEMAALSAHAGNHKGAQQWRDDYNQPED